MAFEIAARGVICKVAPPHTTGLQSDITTPIISHAGATVDTFQKKKQMVLTYLMVVLNLFNVYHAVRFRADSPKTQILPINN